MSADQVVKGMARNGQYWLSIAFRVVEAIEQVDTPWTRGRKTNPQTAGEFGIAAGGEGGSFFVPHLNETQLVLMRT